MQPGGLARVEAGPDFPNSFSHIFVSHLHGDHIGGLPFLLLDAIFPSQRLEPLILVGPPGLEARFRLACEVLYPRSLAIERRFDLNFIELDREISRDIDGLRVTPFEVDHYSGSPSYALRFRPMEKSLPFPATRDGPTMSFAPARVPTFI